MISSVSEVYVDIMRININNVGQLLRPNKLGRSELRQSINLDEKHRKIKHDIPRTYVNIVRQKENIMKTKLAILSLFILVTVVPSFAQEQPKNDLQIMNLKSSVKSVKETSYEAVEKFGEIQKGEKKRILGLGLDFYIIFNEKGNKTEESEYNSDGTLSVKHTYHYNEKGKIDYEQYYRPDGSKWKTTNYTYDEKGNWHEYSVVEGDYYLNKSTYSYDEKGNMIEMKSYKLDKGIRCSEFNYDTTPFYKYTYKYNEKGNLIEGNSYNTDGSLSYKDTYKYDDKGNKTESNRYRSDGRLYTKGLYDDKGNTIEYSMYNLNGSLYSKSTYKYEYDNHNNWTKKYYYSTTGDWIKETGLKVKDMTYILEREIEYY